MTAIHAPGVDLRRPADPCHCGHDLTDHVGADDHCDVWSCACDGFEADGHGPDEEWAR